MTADWGNSHPFMFDLRSNGTTWLVCVECTQWQYNISGMDTTLARSYAEGHAANGCPAV